MAISNDADDTAQSLPWDSDGPTMPLADLEPDVAEHVKRLGAHQINLYRALANALEVLRAWIAFTWDLREECTSPRALRELTILRTAVTMHAEYEWHQHYAMVLSAGVSEEKIAALPAWQNATVFDERERAALVPMVPACSTRCVSRSRDPIDISPPWRAQAPFALRGGAADVAFAIGREEAVMA